jgi:predicted dehydrogenase
MNQPPDNQATRREFLKTSSVLALASTVTFPSVVSAAPNSETLRIGLVGCGGRGTGAAAQALTADSNIVITAMGDVFEAPLGQSLDILRKKAPEKVKVTSDHCFIGFDAYQKVIASGVDVVLLTTPPGFRPLHLKAAIEAGKHAFIEITAGVDAPGVRSVLESAELARKKNLGILSGFCWRYNDRHRGALEKIRNGAIGEIRAIYATYYRGSLTQNHHGPREPWMNDLQWQLRNWHNYKWLSGDVTILLSGGHSVDKMSWWLGDVMPAKAVATGSRQFEAEGNIYDNCFVAYEYANGLRGFLGCRSQAGCHGENADYIIGTKGVCKIGRGTLPIITGETNWRYDGVQNDMYQTEHDEFFASIRAGKPINDGTRMAHTTLMAIMGRMAAYTGQEISWDMALNSREKLTPEILDWNTKVEMPPLSVPGQTKFV